MKEIGDEIRVLPKIDSAKPRVTPMFVKVNVEHADLIVKGKLHCLPYGRRTHHCSDRAVSEVVSVSDRMKIMGQNDPTGRF